MDLLELLSRYQPIDSWDKDQWESLTHFVKTNPNAFDRIASPGHITGSAWLVNESATSVLLTHHRKLNKWLQLGGHADGEKDVLQVALREAKEESGLINLVPLDKDIFDLDIHLIPAYGPDPEHHHYDIRFAIQAQGSFPLVASEESHSLAWIPINEVEKISQEKSLLRMVEKWNRRYKDPVSATVTSFKRSVP